MTNKIKRRIAVTALFLAGLSVLLYPFVSNRIYQYKADRIVEEYIAASEKTDSSTNAGELKKAYKYNESLVGQVPPDTFSEREGIHYDETYDSLLNQSGEGVMACVEIPSITVKLPIYHYSSEETLERGAGHLFGSSLPVGGKGTHTVITAHRGLPSAKMFTDLDLVKKRDLIYIYVAGKTLAYSVDQIKTVKPEDCSDLGIEEDKDQITLVTCTPYGRNTDRLLVRGQRTSVPDNTKALIHHRFPVIHLIIGFAGAGAAFLLLFVINMLKKRRKYKHR